MRGVQRALGVNRHTLALWLLELLVRLPAFRTSVEPARANDVLELDELWSFVGKRQQKRWLWVALCRRTRQIVAFVIGDRSAKTCWKLWQRIPIAYVTAIHSVTCGMPTSKSLSRANTLQLVKKAAKRLTWSGGTTPCASELAAMFANRSRFQRATNFIIW